VDLPGTAFAIKLFCPDLIQSIFGHCNAFGDLRGYFWAILVKILGAIEGAIKVAILMWIVGVILYIFSKRYKFSIKIEIDKKIQIQSKLVIRNFLVSNNCSLMPGCSLSSRSLPQLFILQIKRELAALLKKKKKNQKNCQIQNSVLLFDI
jgi:hypothetical protein